MTTRDDDIRRNDPSMMSGSSTSGAQRIADGMTVYDVNGEKIGVVRGYMTNSAYFTLEKGLFFPHDYYVPMSAVLRVHPESVYLNVRKDDIKNRGWDDPPQGEERRNESFGNQVSDTLNPNGKPRP
jgi:hypothetical protein